MAKAFHQGLYVALELLWEGDLVDALLHLADLRVAYEFSCESSLGIDLHGRG